ncbi:hypothetical protein T4B_13878 [Trichinella pseudospiralis]|uniref:Uncharacterized protein n=1 Tax=Trichinella pseudospiralis TaxID=6337 RepID=A0A0V1II29_TRIPS|nr:hypothetical protein T4B_13878 [Trichinella pseudospiralis]
MNKMQSVVKHQRYYKKRDVFAFDYRSVYPNMPWPDDRAELAFTCQPGNLDKRTKHVLVHVNCSNQRLLCNCDPTRITRTQIGADDDDDDVHLQCIHNWTNLGL